jgi:hypothetical protein
MNFLDRIAGEWRERAAQLAAWTMSHLVNRTDVWGRYLAESQRKKSTDGSPNNAITAPFRDERGKVFLNVTSLEKHFKTLKRRPRHSQYKRGLDIAVAGHRC